LKQLGLLQVNGEGNPVPGKEQNIVMDNCGGLNKNNHVLLLAPCLVEMGYFMRVNMLFLVVGHTKNVCDRRFNNLKKDYHKRNICTYEDAIAILDKSKYVTVMPIDPKEDWRDYYNMLVKAYKLMSSAGLRSRPNDIFSAHLDDNNTMKLFTRVSDLPQHEPVYKKSQIFPSQEEETG
jgi:hypothetical protein